MVTDVIFDTNHILIPTQYDIMEMRDIVITWNWTFLNFLEFWEILNLPDIIGLIYKRLFKQTCM